MQSAPLTGTADTGSSVASVGRDAATAFLDALSTRDFGSLRSLLADDVRFRMLVPGGLMGDTGADDTVARVAGWFGDADPFEVESAVAGDVAGRAAATYRLRLARGGRPEVIEQHVMLDVDADGRVAAIDLLCSGFRAVRATEVRQAHEYDAGDLGCADGLAGAFREQIRGIPVGDLLVVSTRDPAAKEDLPSLARLMGHAVRSTETSDDGRLEITVERRR